MVKTGGGDDFNFLTEENRNFLISDEEIDGACDDIDLDSIASDQKDEEEVLVETCFLHALLSFIFVLFNLVKVFLLSVVVLGVQCCNLTF